MNSIPPLEQDSLRTHPIGAPSLFQLRFESGYADEITKMHKAVYLCVQRLRMQEHADNNARQVAK